MPIQFPEEAQPLILSPRVFRAGNQVELLRDGKEAYPRMLRDIAGAQCQILVEMYIFAGDRTGWRFAEALAARARAGVEVCVMYDALGSKDTDEQIFQFMRGAGVKVVEFRPIVPWRRRFRLHGRNHRKQVVVDGRIAYLGGLNIGDDYASVEDGGKGWRDTAIRIEGPAVAECTALFHRSWQKEEGPKLMFPRPPQNLPGGYPVAVIGSQSWLSRRSIARNYLRALRRAGRRIWIANPYFAPSFRFRLALKRACRHGVDVRLIIPSRCDSPMILYATHHLVGPMLRWGVKIYEWQGPMMHAKTAVIDDHWATVGSYNLDYLSLRHNLEVTALVVDRVFAAKMAAMYEEDLKSCRPIDPDRWRRRPFGRRMLETFWFWLRFLL